MSLLLALSFFACSEYGLDAEPPRVNPLTEDPGAVGDGSTDDVPWWEDAEGTDAPPFVHIEISDADDATGTGTTGTDGTDGTGTTGTDGGNGTDGGGTDGGNGGNTGGTWSNGDPEDPPSGELPEEYPTSECDAADVATFDSAEIWVGNNGNAPTQASGILTAPAAGWYDVYNTPIQESGANQHNESAFFRVQNATNPDGLPLTGNCGDEWVITDPDNAGPAPSTRQYLGTFWLDAGANTLVMTHYCTIWTTCPQLHNDQPANQTCDSGNINSVHFLGDGVCIELIADD